jgi:hypothetical protein
MAKPEKSPFSAEHMAEFHRIQALWPVILRKLGDLLGVWRECGNKTCRRAKSCGRSDATCLHALMQAMADESRRLLRYAVENRRDGLAPDEAIERAQARVEDQIARFGDERPPPVA